MSGAQRATTLPIEPTGSYIEPALPLSHHIQVPMGPVVDTSGGSGIILQHTPAVYDSRTEQS